MTDTPTLTHKRDLILAGEKQFAAQVSAKVIDKPRLDVWMILIPVFFIFYFWQLKRYAKGRRTFAEKFLITRERALNQSLTSDETGQGPDVESVVQASDIPDDIRKDYRRWVALLVDHYRDLILAHGSTYAALVRSVYKNRTNYLLFLNRLNPLILIQPI